MYDTLCPNATISEMVSGKFITICIIRYYVLSPMLKTSNSNYYLMLSRSIFIIC